MIIVYHCYGGTHSSVVAAAIHTNMLSIKRKPTSDELVKLPYYDKVTSNQIGTPFYYGKDIENNKIYILGMKNAEKINKKVIYNLMAIENISSNKVKFINTLNYINIWIRVGGFLSRRLGIINPGRKLTILGIKKNYYKFVKLVLDIKKEIGIAEC